MSPQRPTLPSLHSLGLQTVGLPISNLGKSMRSRKASYSSSSSSRTPSPSPSESTSSLYPPTTHYPHSSFSPAPKLRLIPTTMSTADAIVLVPTHPSISVGGPEGKPMLLLGTAATELRLRHAHGDRRGVRGAKMHPYKIVKEGSRGHSRQSSVSSRSSC